MPSNLHYVMKPQGEMLGKFFNDRTFVSGVIGALGSGKTWTICQKLFVMMCEQPANAQGERLSRTIAIRNTYGDLMNTTVKEWQEKFGHISSFTQGSKALPNSTIRFNLEDGTKVKAEIVYMSADGTAQEVERKFRGVQATFLWANELKELPKAAWDMALSRVGRYPDNCDFHGAIFDTNAPDTDHWLYKVVEEEKPKSWNVFKQPGGVIRQSVGSDGVVTWKVNPDAENIHNLPPNYYENNMQGKPHDWIAVNLGNEYGTVMDGKPVYPEYNDAIHCGEVIANSALTLYIGVDFGLTPAAAIGQKLATGKIVLLDELVSEDMGAQRFGEILKELIADKYNNFEIAGYGDPAGTAKSQADEKTAFDMLNVSSGIRFRPADSNDPILRREALAVPMQRLIGGSPGFMISSNCKMLRKGFQGGYCYERVQVRGDAKYRDTPKKNIFSHVHDAAQYMALGMGLGKPLVRDHHAKPMRPVKMNLSKFKY